MRPRYLNVTDGQTETDGRTNDLQLQYRAMHYVHRAVKSKADDLANLTKSPSNPRTF